MSVQKPFFLAMTIAGLMLQSAFAQSEARFQFVQPGVDSLKGDLKYLVELSPTPALRKQWANTLDPLLDSFAEGLDPAKPIRVDVIIGKDVEYEMHFPISKLEGRGGFIENLKGMGFNVKKQNTLFEVVDGSKGAANKKPMFMRHSNGYASLAAKAAAVPATMPNPITDPAKGVQTLLARGYDVVGSLKNTSAAADIATRRTNFQELRKQLEAGLAFRRNEDKNEFALRKLSLLQNLAEAERFVVEADEVLIGWTTTQATTEQPGKGHAEFTISALPDTSLFKSTQILASKHSYFANVELHDKPAVQGKINFGVDELRAEHLKEFYKTVRPVLEARIDKRPNLKEAEQKKAAREAAGILLDMLTEGVGLGVADLFVDMHAAGDGKHTLTCGVRTADGKKVDELMKLLPKVNAGFDVKTDIQKIGENVSVHSVTIPPGREAAFQKLFPGEKLIYVATSKDAVWGAAGVNAIEELTAAIEQAVKPAPEAIDPRVLYYTANSARMVDLLDVVRPERQKIDESLSKDEQARLRQTEKDLERIRKLAAEATANCEAVFSGEIKKAGDKVEGNILISECVLKFIGSAIADFAKDMQ